MIDWDWSIVLQYRWALLRGLGVTIALTLSAVMIGTGAGIPIGVLLATTRRELQDLRAIVVFVVDVVRSLPLLILLLVFNFWVAAFAGIKSAFVLAVLALSVNLAAFVADLIRAALERIPAPFIDAAYALGMTPGQVFLRVSLPEAVRDAFPTLTILYIDILKLSSLASVIAVPEIVHAATTISAREFRYLEVSAALAGIYVMLVLPLTLAQRRLERGALSHRRS